LDVVPGRSVLDVGGVSAGVGPVESIEEAVALVPPGRPSSSEAQAPSTVMMAMHVLVTSTERLGREDVRRRPVMVE